MTPISRSLLCMLIAAMPLLSAQAASDAENRREWNAPQAPFRIYGNTWYVGPHGLTILLITSPHGDVLIDGGLPESAPRIEGNIRALGRQLRDVKWILNTHAHMDHAGGIAQLARDTGAQVIASALDAQLMARGGRGDPQYGDRYPYQPVHVTRTVIDGESLHLGGLVMTAHLTPGHTKGNTTWTWTSCQDGRCLRLVDAASLSAPGYKLIGDAKYPDIVGDFESSFAKLAALPCDIVLSPHPGVVDFWARAAKRKHGNEDALIDHNGCRDYAAKSKSEFDAQLARERATKK